MDGIRTAQHSTRPPYASTRPPFHIWDFNTISAVPAGQIFYYIIVICYTIGEICEQRVNFFFKYNQSLLASY